MGNIPPKIAIVFIGQLIGASQGWYYSIRNLYCSLPQLIFWLFMENIHLVNSFHLFPNNMWICYLPPQTENVSKVNISLENQQYSMGRYWKATILNGKILKSQANDIQWVDCLQLIAIVGINFISGEIGKSCSDYNWIKNRCKKNIPKFSERNVGIKDLMSHETSLSDLFVIRQMWLLKFEHGGLTLCLIA